MAARSLRCTSAVTSLYRSTRYSRGLLRSHSLLVPGFGMYSVEMDASISTRGLPLPGRYPPLLISLVSGCCNLYVHNTSSGQNLQEDNRVSRRRTCGRKSYEGLVLNMKEKAVYDVVEVP